MNVGHDPICMTFEEWKARPIRRHAFVTRAANGRYELQLVESHLNSYYFMETTHAASADKAHEVLRRWQAHWDISPEDLPEIEKMEEKALRQQALTVAKTSEAVNLAQLLSAQMDVPCPAIVKDADSIGSLELYTKGEAVDRGLVGPGHYCISVGEEILDLGDSIDILPFARRPKASDMTDMDAVVVNYEPDSDEFKRIAVQSLGQKSHCMYGPSFLVFERTTGHFLEFFCGTKRTRGQAKNIYPFLPLTAADIARQKMFGNDIAKLEPHDALPLTLKSLLVEKGTYSWHVPVVVKCARPFTNLPTMDRIAAEIGAFIHVKDYAALLACGQMVQRPQPKPEFEEQAGAVVVRFRPSGYQPPLRVSHDLSDRQRQILLILSGRKKSTVQDIFAGLENPPGLRAVQTELRLLRGYGLVETSGRGGNARWWLSEVGE